MRGLRTAAAVALLAALRASAPSVPRCFLVAGAKKQEPRQLTGRVRRGSSARMVPGSSPDGVDGSGRPLRVKKWSALTVSPTGHRSEELAPLLRGAAKAARGAATVGAGLVALLYITSGFEALMHSDVFGGLLSSRSPSVALATGLLVGCLHTVAGPDHLAGLAPMVAGQRRSPWAAFGLGALWGSGHAAGQLIIGLAMLMTHLGLFRLGWWAGALDQFSGLLVGASLIAIGMLGFSEAQDFEDSVQPALAPGDAKSKRFGLATFATGVLHGLSPDAVIFIAPALALPRMAAIFHVAGVVVGTLLAMGACTALLGALCQRSLRLRSISTGASSVAIALGACIAAASLGITVPLPGLD